MTMPSRGRYPSIADYAFIADCHAAALVSRDGSIDWCCMPRYDAGSIFGRLLDWDRGGFCSIEARGQTREPTRRYLGDSLVLESGLETQDGAARVTDCFTMREGGARDPHRQLVRVFDGASGEVEFRIRIVPRFDYGEVRPWIRHEAEGTFSAIGGDEALVIATDADSIVAGDDHDLVIQLKLKEGERRRLSITFVRPYEFDWESPEALDPDELDARLEYTLEWWRRWATRAEHDGDVLRSAVVLRGLQDAATGAIVAAPTTSLPEAMGGARNWDYRYSWIRDSVFSVRSLAELGLTREADRFRRFVQRACAGHVEDLQIVYGVGGERRIGEQELDLEGYRASSPVRAGNGARDQTQLDAFGELLGLAWRWHRRGHSPGDDTWRFVCELVEAAVERWRQPDSGIWEWRGDPLHFVHSKVMCWSAIHRGLRLAEECERDVPATRWRAACREIREAVESEGYDSDRGVFVQAFGRADMDAALLLLPDTGFIAYDDERMIRTTDAIREELDFGGLLRRYTNSDGLGGDEGAFLACSFWLVECLARQGRTEDAREVYAKTMDARNDLGLFSEEYDPEKGEMLGNFPQALTHLAHIGAALAISSLSST